jgi:chorismate dehydratase
MGENGDSSKPRVSVVRYLNTAPLVWGMLHGPQAGKYELSMTAPARCAEAVRRGEAEVGIIPAIEYQRMEGLEIVPGVSISSEAPVHSVVMFSNVPVEQVRSVAVDESSRTSVALLAILLRRFYGLQARFTPAAPDAAAMLRQADAALVIGDPAMQHRGVARHTYDLATEWRRFTRQPFVFAVWAGPQSAPLAAYGEDFRASRDYGLAHLDDIAAEFAPRHRLTPEAVKYYLTRNINYNLENGQIEGLRLFFRLALEEGLIARQQELRFAGSSARVAPG